MDLRKKIVVGVLILALSGFVYPNLNQKVQLNTPKTLSEFSAIIKKQIAENKFSEANISLKKAFNIYSNNSELLLLKKQLVIADYKQNVLNTNVELVFDKPVNRNKCFEGVLSSTTQKQFLNRLNYLRRLAGIYDSCVLDPELNKRAQSTANLMEVNYQLSHTPSSSWKCYSTVAAATANKSNLSLGYSFIDALMGQMADDGAGNAACGHRRWILNPVNNVFGHGSTNEAMCLYTVSTFNKTLSKTILFPDTQFIAWPSADYFPLDLVPQRWSFSYQGADFSQAKVEVSVNGKTIKTQKEVAEVGYAINTIVFKLNQNAVANQTYSVKISNFKVFDSKLNTLVKKAITYKVTPVTTE